MSDELRDGTPLRYILALELDELVGVLLHDAALDEELRVVADGSGVRDDWRLSLAEARAASGASMQFTSTHLLG